MSMETITHEVKLHPAVIVILGVMELTGQQGLMELHRFVSGHNKATSIESLYRFKKLLSSDLDGAFTVSGGGKNECR